MLYVNIISQKRCHTKIDLETSKRWLMKCKLLQNLIGGLLLVCRFGDINGRRWFSGAVSVTIYLHTAQLAGSYKFLLMDLYIWGEQIIWKCVD